MRKRLTALDVPASRFEIDRPRKTVETRCARPELAANVAFAEWTDSGKLRQTSFKGLRASHRWPGAGWAQRSSRAGGALVACDGSGAWREKMTDDNGTIGKFTDDTETSHKRSAAVG